MTKINIMKRVLGVLAVIILVAIVAGVIMWNKPHRKVEDVKGIAVTAQQLSKEYSADEKAANAKYLNKAIVVTGTISEIDTNENGGLMVVLQTGDPIAGVQCTMRDKADKPVVNEQVTIKGFCSGNSITGVTLTDCVLEKK